jgi:hypothetical protein
MDKKESFSNLKNNESLRRLEEQNLAKLIGGGPTQFTIECLAQSSPECYVTQDKVCGGNHLCTCQD